MASQFYEAPTIAEATLFSKALKHLGTIASSFKASPFHATRATLKHRFTKC